MDGEATMDGNYGQVTGKIGELAKEGFFQRSRRFFAS